VFNQALVQECKKSLNENLFTWEARYNQKTNMWNQIDSINFSGNLPFLINNVMSSKNPFYLSWSFKGGFGEENIDLEVAIRVAFGHLIIGSQLKRF
jgi:hypothetical protein